MSVVGELGYVAGKEGEGAEQYPGETTFTIPSEAKAYVEKTGVDFLAVSIGTVQGRMDGRAKLDYMRLKQLNQAVNIPLVIHGGSGLNEDQFHKLTSNGIAKLTTIQRFQMWLQRPCVNAAKITLAAVLPTLKRCEGCCRQ